ncbi:proline iminopeptidase [Bifidobacterium sp. UTCIF-39]|uniref:alpha/beta fold hydrolase n=1 Tax=Bifidobacterium sp. UTCIF-39 TaxID=1465359 RepID=UPI00112AB3BE|nr:alpha/beta fold hydrolase [Bifidobacterium sp. UTCIF-39]TPF97298.1 proline iminopeptidase [Bifidobacterium sp. UTCIF-39]
MTLLAKYHVPGLVVEDHAIEVPLDWHGRDPMDVVRSGFGETDDGGETIGLFYRVLCAPEHVHDDLPLLVFLQGGPGGQCPRPLGPDDDGWIAEAIRHFRVILPDQRGTGRSSRVEPRSIDGMSARQAADYLKRFLADSIVRDFEYLRLTEFRGQRWVSLGQSYGGFLTLTYLSLFPRALAASFTTGGIPHVPASADEVYAHTFPRMMRKTRQYYERYPQDRARVAAVADLLAGGEVRLPNGDPFSVRRLQMLGSDFGMKPSFERLHWLIDQAFVDGAFGADEHSGKIRESANLSSGFAMEVLARTASYGRPLYWPLQEFIYADGELEKPIRWAAWSELQRHPEFAVDARPLMFTGEAALPWMFEEDSALVPLRPAVDVLMQDTHFGRIYDADQLARNEVPLQAAVYFDDMYVDSGMQLDTLSRIGNAHAWVTNEFEHDGVHHGTTVFRHLYEEALYRGDLDSLL